jgi:hypothetical protein
VGKVTFGLYSFDEYGFEMPESERATFYSQESVPDYLAGIRWESLSQRDTRMPVGNEEVELDLLVVGLSGSTEGEIIVAKRADGSEFLLAARPECSAVYSPRLGDLIRATVARGGMPSLSYLAQSLGDDKPEFHCIRIAMLKPRHLVTVRDPWGK